MTTEQITGEPLEDDEETEAPESVSQMTVSGEKPKTNAELRAYNERLLAERNRYRGQVMQSALAEIGLSHEEGLGVAIVESYDPAGEVSVDAIRAFAEQKYRYQSQGPPPSADMALGNRLDALAPQSSPVSPPVATAAGDELMQKMYDPESTREDAIASSREKMERFVSEHY